MRVFITGCAGYIGSFLTRYLLSKGYKVRCVDALYFGSDVIADILNNPNFQFFKLDSREIVKDMLKDVDAVVDMVAIANDPSAELVPDLTWKVNLESRAKLAKLAKEAGVKKYVVTSSCSVYGFQEEIANEETPPNPLTTYAKANVEVEKRILPLNDKGYCTTALRLATVFGVSRRMRFDLVLNAMVLNAFLKGLIYVDGTGEQRRPLVHVGDVSRAIEMVLRSDKVCGEVINIGSNTQNVTIKQLAEEVAKVTGARIEYRKELVDKRSYAVNFDKAKRLLGFETIYDIGYGIREVYNALVLGFVKPEERWWTVKWYKKLLERGELKI